MSRKLISEDAVFPVRETELELSIPMDPEAVYYLRPLTVEAARSITKQHTRQIPNRRTHQKDDKLDQIAAQDALLDYVIVKWEGVSNGTDKAPCDLAHKLKLPIDIQVALLDRAQIGEADKAQSFRQPA